MATLGVDVHQDRWVDLAINMGENSSYLVQNKGVTPDGGESTATVYLHEGAEPPSDEMMQATVQELRDTINLFTGAWVVVKPFTGSVWAQSSDGMVVVAINITAPI